MHFTTFLSVALTLAAGVVRADDAQVIEDIASTTLTFESAGLVPIPISQDWISGLNAALDIKYDGKTVDMGSKQSVSDIQTLPTYSLSYPSTFKTAQTLYTIMFVDAGVAGSTDPTVTRHMLANNLTLVDGTLKNSSAYVTDYAPPLPATGSGEHRYMQLAFEQPTDFTAPADLSAPTPLANNWDMVSYVNSLKLTLVAASYIQVSVGATAGTVSISLTQAVNTASVQALAQSISASVANAAGVAGGSAPTPTPGSGSPGGGTSPSSGKGNGAGKVMSVGVTGSGLVVLGSVLALFA